MKDERLTRIYMTEGKLYYGRGCLSLKVMKGVINTKKVTVFVMIYRLNDEVQYDLLVPSNKYE